MAARREIESLIFYVLGERNRQLLISGGLEAVPKDSRVAALRGLQDLGWIGHGGFADFEESYSLTKEGKRIVSTQPSIDELDKRTISYVEILKSLDSSTGCARKDALRALVKVQCELGSWDSALLNCYELKGIAHRTKDIASSAYSHFYQGWIEMAQNRWDEALESNLSAVEEYMEAGDRKGVCDANRALGIVYGNRGDHASATRCFETSIAMARAIGDTEAAAKTEANLAIVYDLQGRLDESEQTSSDCLDHFLLSGDLSTACRISNNLGVLNLSKERFVEAAEYFEKTISSCRQINNREVLGAALVNAGYCYARVGNIGKALACTDEAVSVFKEPNNQNMLALAYRNYGYLEFKSSNREKAFEWFEKSVRAAKASSVEDTFAACCYEYGMFLIKCTTDLKLAKKLLKRSSATWRAVGNTARARAADSAVTSV
jgi:tetratricopeptide (TPR) repeat protein